MPHPWHEVEIGDEAPRVFQALVEIPKNSKVKYELEARRRRWRPSDTR